MNLSPLYTVEIILILLATLLQGLVVVEKDGKDGIIDTAGNVMWSPEE